MKWPPLSNMPGSTEAGSAESLMHRRAGATSLAVLGIGSRGGGYPCHRCMYKHDHHGPAQGLSARRKAKPTLCVYLSVVCPFKPPTGLPSKHSSHRIPALDVAAFVPHLFTAHPHSAAHSNTDDTGNTISFADEPRPTTCAIIRPEETRGGGEATCITFHCSFTLCFLFALHSRSHFPSLITRYDHPTKPHARIARLTPRAAFSFSHNSLNSHSTSARTLFRTLVRDDSRDLALGVAICKETSSGHSQQQAAYPRTHHYGINPFPQPV
jgi:hypothetical protein